MLIASVAGGASSAAHDAAAVASLAAGNPVAFAASALSAPPAAVVAASSPHAWPLLVPDCNAAFLNATVASMATRVVVTVAVPAGQAVALHQCRTSVPLWHVRIVLAMGRGSAVALDAWDIAVGGVTIAGGGGVAVGDVADALVVVTGESRIVAGTGARTGSRARSSDPADDVHALSVVLGRQDDARIAGLGIVVTDGSSVRAEHDSSGALFASACSVRAEAAQNAGWGNARPPTLTLERERIVIANGSRVEASAHDSADDYAGREARRAYAATVQVIVGSSVNVSRLAIVIAGRSTVTAFGDDTSAVAAITACSSLRHTTSRSRTFIAAANVMLAVVGPGTLVSVTAKGDGAATSVLGVAAAHAHARASLQNATVYVGGPDVLVELRIGHRGYGASVMGVAARGSSASAMLSDALVFAEGRNTTITARAVEDGTGITVMGVAAEGITTTASMTRVFVHATGPSTNVWLSILDGAGEGASIMGASARDTSRASISNSTLFVSGPGTNIALTIGDDGNSAAVLGAAANKGEATASIQHTTVYAVGPGTAVSILTRADADGSAVLGAAARGEAEAVVTSATFFAGPGTTASLRVENSADGDGAAVLGFAASSSSAQVVAEAVVVQATGPSTAASIYIGGSGGGAVVMGVVSSGSGDLKAVALNFTRCSSGGLAVSAGRASDVRRWNEDVPSGTDVTFNEACGSTPPLPNETMAATTQPPTWWLPDAPPAEAAPRPAAVAVATATVTVRPGASRTQTPQRLAVLPGTQTITAVAKATSHETASLTHRHPRRIASAIATPSPLLDPPPVPTPLDRTTHTSSASLPPPTPPPAELIPPPSVAPLIAAPVSATGSAAVVSGVLLPSSASKPMGNARALQLADACLDERNGGVLSEEAGEWPSDYAVVVARWQIGSGGGFPAAGRAAGAAVAVAAITAACAIAVVVCVPPAAAAAVTTTTTEPPPVADDVAPVSPLAVAAVVGAAYLVPNALESAVVAAAVAAVGSPTGIAGVTGAAVMLIAGTPFFAASVWWHRGPAATGSSRLDRVAAFLHPVLVTGLRDEQCRLLRAHGLLDFTVACVVSVGGGLTQAGVRVGGSCIAIALVMALAATALTAYYATVRPFAARLEVAVATVQAGTLAVLCCLTLGSVATNGDAVSADVLAAAGTAAELVTFAAPVVLLAPLLVARFCRGGGGGGGGGAAGATADGGEEKNGDGVQHDQPLLASVPSTRVGGVPLPQSPPRRSSASSHVQDRRHASPGPTAARNPLERSQ
jgi:hypothetical protein